MVVWTSDRWECICWQVSHNMFVSSPSRSIFLFFERFFTRLLGMRTCFPKTSVVSLLSLQMRLTVDIAMESLSRLCAWTRISWRELYKARKLSRALEFLQRHGNFQERRSSVPIPFCRGKFPVLWWLWQSEQLQGRKWGNKCRRCPKCLPHLRYKKAADLQ